MIRVAFTLIGGKSWMGGHNYLVNLISALCKYEAGRVTPVLFLGMDVNEKQAVPFTTIEGAEVVRSPCFNRSRRSVSLVRSLLIGVDSPVLDAFIEHRIDVVFESAVFFGWRLSLPAIAWIPDMQHRAMPQLFTRLGYWKRELGFQAQVLSRRAVMVSSNDTRSSCESAYPKCRGKVNVVHFAMPPVLRPLPAAEARAVADKYRLPQRFFYMPNQFWRHKNHLLVLQALALLRKRGQPVVVAASGQQCDPRDVGHFPRLEALIHSLGLQDDFRLLGLIPYEDLGALLQASVALLNPSNFEGWSTTVEEARTLGVPMILSDLDVHHEQVEGTARFFDRFSAESLAQALLAATPSRPTDLQILRREAEQRVAQFAARFAQVTLSTIDNSADASAVR